MNRQDAGGLCDLDRNRIVPALRRWYRKHRRRLPWRENRDPYRVWVSEIMLQQTQVATVHDYFLRFMDTFPTLESLAAAEEHDVLRRWEGLGYYRRARQLHAAARQIVSHHDGLFPEDVAALQQLPGIGRYTAGAIASIAFDKPAPILEANTIRLLARLTGFAEDPGTTAARKFLWEAAERLVPSKGAGLVNQALMELGSLVCTPQEPNCDACPLTGACAAFQANAQHAIPFRKPKPPLEHVRHVIVVVVRNNRCLLRKCGREERWSGLWDFPRFPSEQGTSAEFVDRVRQMTGVQIDVGRHLATIRHGVTRFRITLDSYLATVAAGRVRPPAKWVGIEDLPDFALNTTGRRIARLVAKLS